MRLCCSYHASYGLLCFRTGDSGIYTRLVKVAADSEGADPCQGYAAWQGRRHESLTHSFCATRHQLRIREELRRRFAGREWLDVVSKADLPPTDAPAPLPAAAVRVSVATGLGVDALRRAVLASDVLARHAAARAE